MDVLALLWAGVLAAAILAYAVLDGFDLGVGLVFPFLSDREKDTATHTIAPVWDGNETWLVLGGGGLFAAFPLAYSAVFTALYVPLIIMLLALVVRGVSLEYREKTERWRSFWDLGFWGGSFAAAVAQGVMLGAFIQGIEVDGRAYAGGWFDWLTPYSLTCGVAIALGYGLLGTTWLVMKTRSLAARLRPAMFPLAAAVLLMIAWVSAWTPFLDERLTARWFVWPAVAWLLPVPVAISGIGVALLRSTRSVNDTAPFVLTQALFVVTFAGFGVSTYPYIVPHQVTIWEAASPPSSLIFLGVGMLVLLPVVIGYTAHTYWVFRGKAPDELRDETP